MNKLYLLAALMWVTPKVFAQVRFSASTDSSVYHYGDSIHVTITAVNPGNTPDTLTFNSSLQVNYFIDNFSLLSSLGGIPVVNEPIIPPHDSIAWDPFPYPVNIDTLSPGRHSVVAEVIGYWTSDTIWITVDSGAAMVYHVSTDSSVYHYGDSIHVSVSAANIGSEPDTLQLTLCDVAYTIDSSPLITYHPCPLVIVPTIVSAGSWVQLLKFPPYPVTKDTITVGKHAIVGVVDGYGRSDTLWVSVTTVSAITSTSPTPQGYVLENAYPDPFNPSTRIEYRLPALSHVSLTVYDVLGRTVATLVDGLQNPGVHSVTFDAVGLPSGVYFYRLKAGTYQDTKKLLLLK